MTGKQWKAANTRYKPGSPFPGGSNTPPHTSVRIWWDLDVQGYRLEAPYNKEFIDGFKAVIPYGDGSNRVYDPETKLWLIDEKWFSVLKIVADRLFPSAVSYLTREQAEKAAAAAPPVPAAKASLDSVLLSFVKLLPAVALQKAYRTAAMELHPDRQGGSAEKMAVLNSLWQRMEQELKL